MIFNYLQLTKSSFSYSEEDRNQISDEEQNITIQLDVTQRHDIKTSELTGARFGIMVGVLDEKSAEEKPSFGITLLEGSVAYSFRIDHQTGGKIDEFDDHALDTLWLMTRSQILQEFTLFGLPNPPIPLERPKN